MGDNNGPTDIDIGPNDDLVGALEALKRQLPDLLQYMPFIAKLKKAQFDAYIEEGFTPDQALKLIRPGLEI